MSSTARDTLVVVRELFEYAQKSVPIGGYAFDHGKDIFAPLHTAMAERGVETTIFLNDVEGFLEKNWPFGEPFPSIYCDPRTAERESRCSLHAKCIVVDEARALVTSANFTDRGQTRNIEMGVLVDDPGLATRLVHQWRGPHRIGAHDQGMKAWVGEGGSAPVVVFLAREVASRRDGSVR
ncbi:MAG: phospholipase D-like domain-containing protein [Vicinamibacteria bacterium]